MPDTRYYKVVFSDKSELDAFDDDALMCARQEAEKHNIKIAYILRGQNSYHWPYEFVALQYFDAEGKEEPGELFGILLELGMKSRNPYIVAATVMISKHILDEIKKDDGHV